MDIDKSDKTVAQELAELARQGKVSEVKKMMTTANEQTKFVDDAGRLPIHWAASGGHLELVMFLHSLEPSTLDAVDDMGWSPMMIASSAGATEVVRYFLEKAADVDLKNSNGQTCLHYAASKAHVEIARLLLNNDCSVNVSDKYGATPLHRAASKGNAKIVDLILKSRKAQLNLPDAAGNTAFHLACDENRDDTAILLLKAGASTDIKNREEQSGFDLAPKQLRATLKQMADNL